MSFIPVICISGEDTPADMNEEDVAFARVVGKEVARHQATLLTSGIYGFPLWSAEGAFAAGGTVIGVSPAVSKREHTVAYRLPEPAVDTMIYTGFGTAGRDVMLAQSADAIVIGSGGMRPVHEVTLGVEFGKLIGVLTGPWDIPDELYQLANAHEDQFIFADTPHELITRIINRLRKKQPIG